MSLLRHKNFPFQRVFIFYRSNSLKLINTSLRLTSTTAGLYLTCLDWALRLIWRTIAALPFVLSLETCFIWLRCAVFSLNLFLLFGDPVLQEIGVTFGQLNSQDISSSLTTAKHSPRCETQHFNSNRRWV